MTATNTETTTPLVEGGPDTSSPSTALVPSATRGPASVEPVTVGPVEAPNAAPRPMIPATSAADSASTTASQSVPGAGLVTEAELAIVERRWRDALRLVEALDAIDASSVHTDGLLAIAATHLHKHRLANEAVGRLRAHPPTPQIHRHLAHVALARQQFLLADNEVRAALALIDADSDTDQNAQDWTQLAASYAGLGWFDEAADCLDRAEALGANEADTWIIGRSINRWGLSKTASSIIGVALFLFVGLLAVAVAVTVPFIARELRITQLEDRLAIIASDAWVEERWLRLGHAAAVVVSVVVWAVVMQLT